MGNHEWCEDCQTSDFHLGRPCDPKRLAAVQKERAERERVFTMQLKKAQKLVDELNARGFEAEIDGGNVKVSVWSL